jgi:hypothetical protein
MTRSFKLPKTRQSIVLPDKRHQPDKSPIGRILDDNDPANGTIAERIVRMVERNGR